MIVMTFNLRFENQIDNENSWSNRREMVTGLIMKYRPSILGTQEGKGAQLDYLKDNLPEYCIFAPQREMDDISQYPTIFFRKDEFVAVDGGEFWLSKTPNQHLSKDWDSAFPRMISYCRVRPFDGGPDFWAAVTHLDHIGEQARLEQAKIIADWVIKQDAPVILMGDFNDGPGSPAHRVLTAPETGLIDTWQALKLEEGPAGFTHHKFTGVPQQARMDWILASNCFGVTEARIIRDHFEGRYPSDHFPYMTRLVLLG
ncbi:Endonuclease/exonuclease/phosphatase family protein [uncultured Desulfobacterium sp.]|uniref:Endonuclease/exonuclease/phosphatase family protein n=1 Tax=uncultured Desulfobacterium sp. TaxID=201089 RepID=A0A445MVF6_9BACT|nr:Endonuclease/exonuclease/phosphatase family protein [uncultured Desulfobacterium sp.]